MIDIQRKENLLNELRISEFNINAEEKNQIQITEESHLENLQRKKIEDASQFIDYEQEIINKDKG